MHKVLLQDDFTACDIRIHEKLIYYLQGGAFTRALCEACAWSRGRGRDAGEAGAAGVRWCQTLTGQNTAAR